MVTVEKQKNNKQIWSEGNKWGLEDQESTIVMKKYQDNPDKTEPPLINHSLLTSKENKWGNSSQ